MPFYDDRRRALLIIHSPILTLIEMNFFVQVTSIRHASSRRVVEGSRWVFDGYSSYKKIEGDFNPEEQRKMTTMLGGQQFLDVLCTHMKGFPEVYHQAKQLAGSLDLLDMHVLSQSSAQAIFSWHQDTEQFAHMILSVVVMLTDTKSSMHVASFDEVEYKGHGSGLAFLSNAVHRSGFAEFGTRKIAFFFGVNTTNNAFNRKRLAGCGVAPCKHLPLWWNGTEQFLGCFCTRNNAPLPHDQGGGMSGEVQCATCYRYCHRVCVGLPEMEEEDEDEEEDAAVERPLSTKVKVGAARFDCPKCKGTEIIDCDIPYIRLPKPKPKANAIAKPAAAAPKIKKSYAPKAVVPKKRRKASVPSTIRAYVMGEPELEALDTLTKYIMDLPGGKKSLLDGFHCERHQRKITKKTGGHFDKYFFHREHGKFRSFAEVARYFRLIDPSGTKNQRFCSTAKLSSAGKQQPPPKSKRKHISTRLYLSEKSHEAKTKSVESERKAIEVNETGTDHATRTPFESEKLGVTATKVDVTAVTSFESEESDEHIEVLTEDGGETSLTLTEDVRGSASQANDGEPESSMEVDETKRDVLLYFHEMKKELQGRENNIIHNEFFDIMKNFESRQIDRRGAIRAVRYLFNDNEKLLNGFERFLPGPYQRTTSLGNEKLRVMRTETETEAEAASTEPAAMRTTFESEETPELHTLSAMAFEHMANERMEEVAQVNNDQAKTETVISVMAPEHDVAMEPTVEVSQASSDEAETLTDHATRTSVGSDDTPDLDTVTVLSTAGEPAATTATVVEKQFLQIDEAGTSTDCLPGNRSVELKAAVTDAGSTTDDTDSRDSDKGDDELSVI